MQVFKAISGAQRGLVFAVLGLSLWGVVLATPQQPPDLQRLFLGQFDGNQDGRVDIDEFLVPSREQFKVMDKDADGYVTGDEAAEYARKMRERMARPAQQSAPQPAQ